METAAFAESFAPIVQCEKREIHPVFPLFPHFPLGQNLSAKALAPLCGIALKDNPFSFLAESEKGLLLGTFKNSFLAFVRIESPHNAL